MTHQESTRLLFRSPKRYLWLEVPADAKSGDSFVLWWFNEEVPFVRGWDEYEGKVTERTADTLTLAADTKAELRTGHPYDPWPTDDVFTVTLKGGIPVAISAFDSHLDLILAEPGSERPATGRKASKRVLKLIGNFRETGDEDEPNAPSLQGSRGKRNRDHKDAVIRYLRNAENLTYSMSTEPDYFDRSKRIGSSALKSDGVYIWPDYLAGYLERYDVALPQDFERHMEAHGWKLPEKLNRDDFDVPPGVGPIAPPRAENATLRASDTGKPTVDPVTGKRILKLIGNYREMGYDDQPNAPSLLDVRGKRTKNHEAEVVAYLKKAQSISFSPGFVADFFDSAQEIGTLTMRTDGTYVWPDFVAGYVQRYRVALPEEFEQHMAERGWRLPEKLDRDGFTLPW